jgi:ectonucleoside triphosphate diphosphohydrolase 4
LEFFGTSEFFYTMRDTLRISGRYSGTDFNKSAREYCQTDWSVLEERFRQKLYPYADLHRLKSQCAKSAWMSLILHDGLGFPRDNLHLTTAAEISQHNAHWSLGALLYLTRYLPLREIQALQQSVSPSSSHSPSPLSSLIESSFLLPCLVVVFVAVTLLICRHRRPRSSSSYCGLYADDPPIGDLLRSHSQVSMNRNLSSRKLNLAVP